jgi:hypothetical protein
MALKSGEWFFRFVILGHFFHKLIHLNYWSEILRPPLGCTAARQLASGLSMSAVGFCKCSE